MTHLQRKHDHVLSLGADCQPAFQIQHHIGSSSSIFDWLVTPIEGLIRIINQKGSNLGLDFIAGRDTVYCAHYDVIYHHEFDRISNGMVKFDLERCRSAREKLLHKMNNFDKICRSGGSILFIRRRISTDALVDRFTTDVFSSVDANRIVDCLASTYPDLAFTLLLMIADTDRSDLSGDLDPRIVLERVPEAVGYPRFGPDEWWDRQFDRLGVLGVRAHDQSQDVM